MEHAQETHTAAPIRLLCIGFAALILIFSLVPIIRNWNEGHIDYRNIYAAGHRVLHGVSAYAERGAKNTASFIYPPTAAALLAPLTVRTPWAMVVVLVGATSAAWVASVLLSVYLAAGRVGGQSPWLYAVPVLYTVPYVWDMYWLGQPNLVLLACVLGALACLRLHRPLAAGALVALATAVKAFPVTVLVYLVWRRQWRAALATVAVLAGLLLLLPAPFRGFRGSVADVRTWCADMMFHYDAQGIGQRDTRSYCWRNQSLAAVAHRLLRPLDANRSRDPEMFVNVADLSFRQITLIILAAAGVLGLAYLWAMPPPLRRTDDSDALEWAILLLLTLICSPYLFNYYNVWLLYPCTVLVHRWLGARRGTRERFVLAAALLISWGLLGMTLQLRCFYYVQALGNVLWAHLLLFGILIWQLRRARSGIAALEAVQTGA